jgi:hypothetical protein
MQLIIKIFMEKPLGIFKTLAKNLKKNRNKSIFVCNTLRSHGAVQQFIR